MIAVCASKKERRALLTVLDDGVGIPASADIGCSSGFGFQLVDMLTT
jgi:two-component sensor histidine kinase